MNKFSNEISENIFSTHENLVPEKGFTFQMENDQSKEISKDTLAKSNCLAQGFAKLTDSVVLTTSFFQNIYLMLNDVGCGKCVSSCQHNDIKIRPFEPSYYMINKPFVYAPVFVRIGQHKKKPKIVHKHSPPIALSQISIPKTNNDALNEHLSLIHI